MSACSTLLELYQEWRKWTDAEGEAILENDWPKVKRCQAAKAELQPHILQQTEKAQATSLDAVTNSLNNGKSVLDTTIQAGGQMTDIVKLTIFVRDRDDYLAKQRALGDVWRRYFGDYYPALALFEVSGFFQRDALIELEGVAVLEDGS